MFVRGAVALVILVAAYWGWALAGAAQLASAASRGDAQAVMERVDLQSLIRSLSSQIGRAYLDSSASKAAVASAGRLSKRLRRRDAVARPSDAGQHRGAFEPGTRGRP
jgi:Protein of unknown function (DUF2939)